MSMSIASNRCRSTTMTRTIGFIGLGTMGYPMASHFPDLHIYDVDSTTLDRFARDHTATICTSTEQVISSCDVIISIVPEGKHVRAIFDPILASSLALEDKIFLECSTIDIATSKLVAQGVTSKGGIFVDAPVSGGPAGAQAAKLTIMAGMDASHPHFEEITEILGKMGKVIACGGGSMGLVTKLCNNYVSGTIALATSEGYNLAMRLGLDPRVFHEVLLSSSGGSWVNANVNPVPGIDPNAPSSKDYAGGFKVQLMKKDYGLAVEAAKEVGAKLYLGEAGLDVYTKASDDPKCVDRDSRVVYRFIGGKEDWQKE